MQDLWHDRIISFCIVSSLVAVIAPLLLLFGLRFGIVNQLQNDLPSQIQRRNHIIYTQTPLFIH